MANRTPAAPEDSLDPVLDFMRLLWRIEHGLQATSKRMDARLGITGPQRLVLRLVTQFPGLSAGDVARLLHLHPSTITGILQRLVDKGLLIRDPDPRDTRRARLRPGRRANGFARQSGGTVEAAVALVLEQTPAVHVRHARAMLEALAGSLEETP
jgi:DNA-binding MarR family transcriptional regulator